MTQTTNSPETESKATQSTTVFHLGLSWRLLDLRNFAHTKKARKGGETSAIRLRKLNMRLTLNKELRSYTSKRTTEYIGLQENKATSISSCTCRRWG